MTQITDEAVKADYAVKQLEWVDAKGVSEATEFGRLMRYFAVHVTNGKGEYSWTLEFNGEFFRQSKTLDEAKSIAQADFERRVRECIVGGFDVTAVREAIRSVNIHEEANNYEWRGDGDYTPNEQEKALLEDFGNGLVGAIEDAIRALSAEPAQCEQWQQIKPKLDGTEYLTWNGRRYHVAKFDKVENEWVSSFTTVTKRLPISPRPTHWMPLPAAPTKEEGR